MNLKVRVSNYNDVAHAYTISKYIEKSANFRKTGISKRDTKYFFYKILKGNAIFAILNKIIVGFSYIDVFEEKFITHSGMIILPIFRSKGISKYLKYFIFKFSYYKFPIVNIASITTNYSILKLNIDFKFKIVSHIQLSRCDIFWNNCETCSNYYLLIKNNRDICLCTVLFFINNKL